MHIDDRFTRPHKAAAIRKLHEAELSDRRELSSERFPNATVLPLIKFEEDKESLLFGRGAVIDEQGRYAECSGIPGRVGGFYEHETPPLTEEKVVFCGYLARGWGHFLIESITRLWYALSHEGDADRYVFVTGENGGTAIEGNFRIFLELFGILDRTVLLDRPARFREVIVPERAYVSGAYTSEAYNEILDKVLSALPEDGSVKPGVKLFLSRAHLYDKKHFYGRKRSRERGLDMLDDFFSRNGFTILYPERVDLITQLKLMRNAALIASESGSCAHNMLLAPRGAKTLILERQALPNRFQAEIDRVRDLDTCYVDAYYALYPTADFGGPYLLMYNDYMKRYAEEHSLTAPDAGYTSPSYYRASARWFIRLYRHLWGARLFWGDEIDRISDWSEVFAEANEESYEVFRPYLENGYFRFKRKLREKLGY